MSLARTYVTKKVRKDWVCGKCGDPIRKGVDGRISFSVGFRGYEQTRCMKTECYPKPSERESSLLADVYAAQEGVDFSSCESADDFTNALEDIAAACDEVADQYEANEMIEINYELQERADQVRAAGEELRSWSPEEDEPQEGDFDSAEEYSTAHDEWVETTAQSAEDAVNDMDLP